MYWSLRFTGCNAKEQYKLEDAKQTFSFAENTSDMQTSLQNIVQYFSDAAESFVKVQFNILRYIHTAGNGTSTGNGSGSIDNGFWSL